MKKNLNLTHLALKSLLLFCSYLFMTLVHAGNPLWLFTPLTRTSQQVPANSSVTVKYLVTNQTSKPRLLTMSPIPGIAQIGLGIDGNCPNPFLLQSGASCVLSLQANGYLMNSSIYDGPVVCPLGSTQQCYRPSATNVLHLTKASAIPLPPGCIYTGNNNIQCFVFTNYGFTNMTYALCRSAQCAYNGIQTEVTCSCKLIQDNQGMYSASVAPSDYVSSKPVGNMVTSTYSMVDSSGETPTNCPSAPFANCFGAPCVAFGNTATCTCPVETAPFIAPETNCNAGTNLIWSATSQSSFPDIESAMLYMYDTFFGGNRPS